MKKNFIQTLIVVVTTFLLTFLVSCESSSFAVNFYYQDELIDSFDVTDVSKITDEYINSVIDKIDKKDGCYYRFSLSKLKYIEFTLDDLKSNTNLYLFEFEYSYRVTFVESDDYKINFISDLDLKFGEDFEFEVINTSTLYPSSEYVMRVFINDLEIISKNNVYINKHVTGDFEIVVVFSKIISLELESQQSEYNGLPQLFTIDFQETGLTLNDIEILYYKDINNTILCTPIDCGHYYVIVKCINNNYYFEEIHQEMIIYKKTIDMSGVSFVDKIVEYDGNIHNIEIEGILPEEVTVNYSEGKINAGIYEVTATFTVSNNLNINEIKPLKATLEIKRVELKNSFLSITFDYVPKKLKYKHYLHMLFWSINIS